MNETAPTGDEDAPGDAVDVAYQAIRRAIIDRISTKYVGGPYPRGEERIVYRVAVDHAAGQSFG